MILTSDLEKTSSIILTYDSGLGGLSVFRHLTKLLPNHTHLYVADDVLFPFGDHSAETVRDHCLKTLSGLIDSHQPLKVVIACNTASTLILPPLREKHGDMFVGTVPAIKPAATTTKTGMISVLATPGTVKRDYTQNLIEQFAADYDVALIGAPGLAEAAEEFLRSGKADRKCVRDEVADCFRQHNGRRTDTIVLACTHYPFLLPILRELAPWPVKWIDPGLAVAQRCASLLAEPSAHKADISFQVMSNAPFPLHVWKQALMGFENEAGC